MQVVALQVFRNEVIEPVFAFFRGEFFHQRQALGVGNVCRDLSAQGAMAHGFEPRLECLEHLLLIQVGKLLPKTLQVAECMLINKTHQPKQLQQGVLQGSRGEK